MLFVGASIVATVVVGVVRALRGSQWCRASHDFVLMHVLLLGQDFEVLDQPELGRRCRALAEKLLSAGATNAPATAMEES